MHKGETGLTPSRVEDVIAGSINASPRATSTLRSRVIIVVVVMTGHRDTENTSEDEEQLEVVGHCILLK
jgi:hypothetical protein